MNIADQLTEDAHEAIRRIQQSVFTINMNLHKPSTPRRRMAMQRAAQQISDAVAKIDGSWPL